LSVVDRSHAVIPAPARVECTGDRVALPAGTPVTFAFAPPEVGPLVERFCGDVARRTDLRLVPAGGDPAAGGPVLRIEPAGGDDLAGLPAPLGACPTGGSPPDERYALAIDAEGVVLRAAAPVGVARGLTTLLQLLATGDGRLPAGRIVDGPRYAWRGLSLDTARAYFPLDDVWRVVDLLALYKLNVLHLHPTDDESWRLPVGRPAGSALDDGVFYDADDLRALVAYAADRFVTVVPEVDTPGHTTALVQMHPALHTGRNEVRIELVPGHEHRATWLDPEEPATFALVEEVLAGVADLFPGPYLHIGGDEPHGMPHDLYAAYVTRVRDVVRSLGRRPLGWQESARAGLGPDDMIQYWFADIAVPASTPRDLRAQLDAELALSQRDLAAAEAVSAPVIVSPLGRCYLDVPYAEPSADPDQADRQRRAGLRLYRRATVDRSFDWEPAEALGPGREALVAGVEAAIWAETISDLDDLTFLVLPRLPGVAHRAWSAPQSATWDDHRASLAGHGRLWDQDGLTWFRASSIDWG
jgi:hexosaminidase